MREQRDHHLMDAADLPVDDLRQLMKHARWVAWQLSRIPRNPDAESDALLGLTKGIRDYDPDNANKASLFTYVHHRIRGEVLDGLRIRAHMSRRDLQNVIAGTKEQTGAMKTPVSITLVQELMPSWDVADPNLDTEKVLAEKLSREQYLTAWELIGELCSARDARVMHAVFVEGWTMASVGKRHQITESRVSQIVSATLAMLRKRLGVQGVVKVTWKPPASLVSTAA